ncbi:exopolysaccharide biosynthesis polyprenyl glycosylphosphotransferase [Pseudoruegeria sp. SK021]|uniref:exopolysaccharide biosynthesis polyprenyl glycosylphosphotransferase n=1 Tax=Pseudoruegeria sp. SK021 TaxID=1933035 RepID=UPI000A23E7BD|nr:exopolysaccharide biosynthesis polyprenyl glycosylphosphotransferase [Pseudoruegeria sp. SK021]OSP54364.1 hypothetical protein BV911_12850 [Pseudoruegeria sp. SK021]
MNRIPQFSTKDTGLSDIALHVARHLKRAALAPIWIAVIVSCIDLVLFSVLFWFVRFSLAPLTYFQTFQTTVWALCAAGSTVALLGAIGGYRVSTLKNTIYSIGYVIIAGVVPFGMVATFDLGPPQPDHIAEAALASVCLTILPGRYLISRALRWALESGLTERRAVIVGGGSNAEHLIRGLVQRPENDIRICAIFDDRQGERSPDLVLDVPKIGHFSDLLRFARQAEIDLIIITLPRTAEARIAALLTMFRVLPIPVHLSSFSNDLNFRDRTSREIDLIDLLPPSFRPERRLAKRSFDLVIGSLALLLAVPVMIAIALAIRLDSPGPILFGQVRHGFNDLPINVLKFRTMYVDSCDPGARRVVTKGDPRVTWVGRVLRKTSLDELPQLFNVLTGSLSLVGPRPHAVNALSSRQEQFNEIVDGYSARHRLPPGITGWAQIHGLRGEIDDPEALRARFAYDLFYIENWSLWLDVKILLRTPLALLDTRHAY